jgi:hypothetical protein
MKLGLAWLLDLASVAALIAGVQACGSGCDDPQTGTLLVVLDAFTLDPVCAAEVAPLWQPYSDCHAIGIVWDGGTDTAVEITAPGYLSRSYVVIPKIHAECGLGARGGCNVALLQPDGS